VAKWVPPDTVWNHTSLPSSMHCLSAVLFIWCCPLDHSWGKLHYNSNITFLCADAECWKYIKST